MRPVVLALAVLVAGCPLLGDKEPKPEPPLRGTLRVTYDSDPPIALTHALAVSAGGKSFRLYMTNKPLSCDWAKRDSWAYRKGEATVRFDVAPILQPDGSTRWEIGTGWWGNEHLSDPKVTWHAGSILASQHWPIDLTSSGSGCPTKIRFDGQRRSDYDHAERTFALEGDFVPGCCLTDVPKQAAGITIKIGGDVYPITHADWVRSYKSNEELYRLRAADPSCARTVWYDDVVLDVYVNVETQKKRVVLLGRSLYWSREKRKGLDVVGGSIELARVKDGNHLELHTLFDVAHPMADSATFRVAVDGVVPITAGCGE